MDPRPGTAGLGAGSTVNKHSSAKATSPREDATAMVLSLAAGEVSEEGVAHCIADNLQQA